MSEIITCRWGKQARKPCGSPACCTVEDADGIKTLTCNFHMTVAEKCGWKIFDVTAAPPTDSEKLVALRESVRGLVGEWREKAVKLTEIQDRNEGNILGPAAMGSAGGFETCADELSALIDGKGEKDGQ